MSGTTPPSDPVAAWASSGAMWLSGRPDGTPLLAPGDPAGLIERRLSDLSSAATLRTGHTPILPIAARLLGERAALVGLSRRGPASAGGAFRTLRTSDGWFGLSLARADDLALLPALVQGPVEIGETATTTALSAHPRENTWAAVAVWAGERTSAQAVERAHLLGLPASAWPPPSQTRPAVLSTVGGRRTPRERPLIIDLTSLWAGPLCASALSQTGCQVVKVESSRRLDGARRGSPAFYNLLHAGHDSVTLDFTDSEDQRRLGDLLAQADLVLEASRPRALAALGIDAASYVEAGVSWLSITARGRASDTVGFGDDVAVDAGLAVIDGDDLLPLGDALADPLAGATAAAVAAAALLESNASLIDLSMVDATREALGPVPAAEVTRHGEEWWVETATGRHRVEAPSARPAAPPAADPGRDNARWLL